MTVRGILDWLGISSFKVVLGWFMVCMAFAYALEMFFEAAL